MGLKVVHINREEVCKDAEAKAIWEAILKPKWEQQARERGAKLLADLKGAKTQARKATPPKIRG